MAKIHLDCVKPGMILQSDIRDLNGTLLAASGSAVSEKHLYIFRAWGITEADIRNVTEKEVESPDTTSVEPLVLRNAQAALHPLFRHTDETCPVIRELFRACALRIAKRESGER